MKVTVDASKLLSALKGIRQELPSVVNASLDTLARAGVTNAQSSTVFKNQTGKLRKGIQFRVNGTYKREVFADQPYAFYVEEGNNQKGPRIYPKNGKALRFVINGQVLFRKWVRSHGPLRFMRPARDLVESLIPVILLGDIERLIARHTKG